MEILSFSDMRYSLCYNRKDINYPLVVSFMFDTSFHRHDVLVLNLLKSKIIHLDSLNASAYFAEYRCLV